MNIGVHSSVQSLSCVQLFATPWTTARQASLSITNSWSLLKFMSIESVMPSTISSSVIPFSSCLQSFLASGSFQMSQFFSSGSQINYTSIKILKTKAQRYCPISLSINYEAVLFFLLSFKEKIKLSLHFKCIHRHSNYFI